MCKIKEYEARKKEIAESCASSEDYERKIKELAEELGI